MLFELNQYYTNLRFGLDSLDNPFEKTSSHYKPTNITFLSSFLIWTFIDDSFYYNLVKNKDKKLAKRKVTFGQTLTTQLPNILSEREQSDSRYRIRYQVTRNNNSPEESSDNDDDDDDDNNNQGNNPSLNHQPPNQPLN